MAFNEHMFVVRAEHALKWLKTKRSIAFGDCWIAFQYEEIPATPEAIELLKDTFSRLGLFVQSVNSIHANSVDYKNLKNDRTSIFVESPQPDRFLWHVVRFTADKTAC